MPEDYPLNKIPLAEVIKSISCDFLGVLDGETKQCCNEMDSLIGVIWDAAKCFCGCVQKDIDLEKNLKLLEDERKGLEDIKKDVEEQIEEAHLNNSEVKISHRLNGWRQRVEAIQQEIEAIEVQGAQEILNKCLSQWCPKNCRSSYKLGKNVAKMLKDVDELATEGKDFGNRDFIVPHKVVPRATEMRQDEVVGLDLEWGKKVAKMLREVEDLKAQGQSFGRNDQIDHRPPNNQVPLVPVPSSVVFEHSLGTFTYEELELATEGFSESNFLGQGGFGTVHKGILPNKQTVAIKQQKSESKQGMQEFQTEVNVISRVHHRHLVSLVGYCIAKAQMTLMLVYEFVPNKTLDFHLHGKGTETLDWSTRMKIANGSAKGLAYLHEDCVPKVIHRDIKAANILLNNNFEPKIADFGLAKLSSDTDTHVSASKIKGTFGYLAPEYASSGKLSEKADVFSFGVVLLELIAGRKPVLHTGSFTDDSLVEWARPLLSTALENRNFGVLADPRLQNNYNSEEMFRMASCAANCVRHLPDHRPRMSQVMDALTGKIILDNPKKERTQGDNQDLNKFWKQTQGGNNEPTSSSLENTTEASSYSASG